MELTGPKCQQDVQGSLLWRRSLGVLIVVMAWLMGAFVLWIPSQQARLARDALRSVDSEKSYALAFDRAVNCRPGEKSYCAIGSTSGQRIAIFLGEARELGKGGWGKNVGAETYKR
jgi:hypothetical protein